MTRPAGEYTRRRKARRKEVGWKFKRRIKGTHVSVKAFHLEAYVDSEAYRFNYRYMDDSGGFVAALPSAIGKRLTYKTLIGEDLVSCSSRGSAA
jgi:hypothetical protein